jgi:3-oxoadipate enol-lactonase
MAIVKSPTSHFHLTTAGTKLHYLQFGSTEGPLLLCLHGLGGSRDTFLPLLPVLPKSYKIILVDFQGFGKSPLIKSPNTISVARHVADMGDLIAAVQRPSRLSQPRGIIVIGHSLGAIIALQYAAQHPNNVNGLVLIGSGRSAAHIPAVRRRMLDLAASVRTQGIAFAADLAATSNFYEDT